MAKQVPYATMKVGVLEYSLPRYMQRVLELAGLADGNYTMAEFLEKINQVEYLPERDGEISLFVDVAKLLFTEFATMTDPKARIGLANVRKATEVEKAGESIDLVDRALPKPKITDQQKVVKTRKP